MGKRPRSSPPTIPATGSDAVDERTGVADSTDRVAKQRCTEPPTFTATGDAAADEHDGGSTSAKGGDAGDEYDGDFGDEYDGDFDSPESPTREYPVRKYPFDSVSVPADPLATLGDDIMNFDKDPTVLAMLSKFVSSGRKVQTAWFNELRLKWEESRPQSPLEATRVVLDVIKKVHPVSISSLDLHGILKRYGLPYFSKVVKADEWDDRQYRLPRQLRNPLYNRRMEEAMDKEIEKDEL